MAKSNRDQIGSALDKFVEGMVPFVQREMHSKYSDLSEEKIREHMRSNPAMRRSAENANIAWDAVLVIQIINDQWQYLFRYKLDKAHRSMLLELQESRNKWAHQEAFTTDDAIRTLDTIHRLLSAVSAGDEAAAVDRIKQGLLRTRYSELTRNEEKKANKLALEGQPQGGLRPWREVVTPHRDVASGRFAQAEFAADMAQVLRGDAPSEYADPAEFFRRTYITEGLRGLLLGTISRLSGKGGDPVIELQTNFGGGKTHSMLALYHLVSGVAGGTLTGVDALMNELQISSVPKANRAVLVGTALSAGQSHKKPDGTVVRTLWGEMAWQLMGKKGFALVAESDKNATNPGSDLLTSLFKAASPCLVLIDEWVAYIRQTFNTPDLPGGSFDSNLSFAQSLTEAAKAVPTAQIVASLPQSRIEVGGEGGQQALNILQNTFTRVKSSWRPASQEESYEIVRRRLFESINPENYPARDAVVRAFSDLYRNQEGEFPTACKERDYYRQLELAYPIHPELFDRLYTDWSSLDEFQRTRGVLRLMAAAIHSLWDGDDKSLMILPAMIPMDDPVVQGELTTKSGLSPAWSSVIEKDIDGPSSLPRQLDGENPNLGRYSASRRVARTIYIGSAPLHDTARKGIDDRRVKLGCVQPGESVAIFGDAIRRLSDGATHLYVDGSRFWFSTQPSVSRLAQDRAAQQDPDDVNAELVRRLRLTQKSKGQFAGVHAAPASSADIPDVTDARLVILSPEFLHTSKGSDSTACQAARDILEHRGNSPRIYRNTLVFLAADAARIEELKQAIRNYLAWKSIHKEAEQLNLDAFQSNQAKTKAEDSELTVEGRIPETFQWLLVPVQPEPAKDISWQTFRLQGEGGLAERASKRLINEELLNTVYAGVRLRMDLDRVPLWRSDGNHISVKQLCEDVAQYTYLPRFSDESVVIKAIEDGVSQLGTWEEETFGYAASFDKDRNRYVGMKTGIQTAVRKDNESVIVHPRIAAAQLERDEQDRKSKSTDGTTTTTDRETKRDDDGGGTNGDTKDPEPKLVTRFYGSVSLSGTRMGRDAARVADEVIAHLAGLPNADAKITLDVEIRVPDGISDQVIRTVSENCKTLKFESQGFEAE